MLLLRRTVPFIFEGESHEIRVFSEEWKITVQAFKGNTRVNGFNYSVDLATAFDLKRLQGLSAVELLISRAREDVESHAWKKFEDELASMSQEERDRPSRN